MRKPFTKNAPFASGTQGFTLLEVIIAVSVAAVLAGAIAPVVMSRVSEGRVARATQDLERIAAAIQAFYRDTGRLPPLLPALVTRGFAANDACGNAIDWNLYPAERWRGPYLTTQDYDAAGLPVLQDAWGQDYHYRPDMDGDCTNLDTLSFNPNISGVQALLFSTGVQTVSLTTGDGSAVSPFALNDDDGDGAGDEDPIDGLDNDADGATDEDPPNTARSANFYHFVSVTAEINEKTALTTRRLDALEAAVRTFYADTGRMPPSLEALISLNIPYDDNFDGVIGAAPPEAIDPLKYPNWQGPYLSGGLPLEENSAFVDGWGSRMSLIVFVDGSAALPPQGLHFDDNGDPSLAARNDPAHPLQRYQGLLLSAGQDLRFDLLGSGRADNLSFDNDGDGTFDEDPVNGIDDDGDGRTDEDPDETLSDANAAGLVLIDLNGDDREDVGGASDDAHAPDPFRLISIRDDIGGKAARVHAILDVLNDAANRFHVDVSGVNEDGDLLTDEDILDGIDNDLDGNTDEDPAGFADLDWQEDHLGIGKAFHLLLTQGYIGGSYQNDPWGNPMQWKSAEDRFFTLEAHTGSEIK